MSLIIETVEVIKKQVLVLQLIDFPFVTGSIMVFISLLQIVQCPLKENVRIYLSLTTEKHI